MTAKGYWIARVDVVDAEAYREYTVANAEAFRKYGARFVVRGGQFQTVEGGSRGRNVVIEFPTYQAALDCWNSAEYAKARAVREGAGIGDIIVVEGYEGPQPVA